MNFAKNFKSSKDNSDSHYLEKLEMIRLVDSKYKVRKLYFSKPLESFIVQFNTKLDESEVYLLLAKMKKNYSNLNLDLKIEYNKEEYQNEYTLKVNYETKLISAF